jgi:hypothetical protein
MGVAAILGRFFYHEEHEEREGIDGSDPSVTVQVLLSPAWDGPEPELLCLLSESKVSSWPSW